MTLRKLSPAQNSQTIPHFAWNLSFTEKCFSANPWIFLRLNYVNSLHAWKRLSFHRVSCWSCESGLHLRRGRYFRLEGLPAARSFSAIKFNVYLTWIYIARGTDNKWSCLSPRQAATFPPRAIKFNFSLCSQSHFRNFSESYLAFEAESLRTQMTLSPIVPEFLASSHTLCLAYKEFMPVSAK